MFKKFKDKLTEEMKQSPARFQAGMQHLAQVRKFQLTILLVFKLFQFLFLFFRRCHQVYLTCHLLVPEIRRPLKILMIILVLLTLMIL